MAWSLDGSTIATLEYTQCRLWTWQAPGGDEASTGKQHGRSIEYEQVELFHVPEEASAVGELQRYCHFLRYLNQNPIGITVVLEYLACWANEYSIE